MITGLAVHLMKCGMCGAPLDIYKEAGFYRCPEACMERSILDVDEWVGALIAARLVQADALPEIPLVEMVRQLNALPEDKQHRVAELLLNRLIVPIEDEIFVEWRYE